jgi:hypothetical protein
MTRLPTLGGDFGEAVDLNEFGQIVGTTTIARGAIRATLWTPAPGPLAVEHADENTLSDVAASPGSLSTAGLCARGRKLAEGLLLGLDARRACLAR